MPTLQQTLAPGPTPQTDTAPPPRPALSGTGWAAAAQGEPPAEATDDALLARVAAGDRAAFAALARRHTAKALSVAQRVLGDAAEADEVVQEAWLKVWSRADQWRPDGPARFSTWLHRVVVNLCLDRRRKPGAAPLEDAPDVPDPAPGALASVARAQVAGRVAQALAALPDRQRAALSLCYYEEMSAPEAGRVLNLSVDAVESLLARARRGLRARLAALGITGAEEEP